MATKLGLEAKCYYNANTYAAPTWTEIKRVKDLTLSLEKGEFDVSTRASGGWREIVNTLKDGSVEFGLLQAPTGTDTVFGAIRDAFLNGTSLEFLVLDGSSAASGSQGLRATMTVSSFQRSENLEEAIMYDVSVRPTPADNAPAWYTV